MQYGGKHTMKPGKRKMGRKSPVKNIGRQQVRRPVQRK